MSRSAAGRNYGIRFGTAAAAYTVGILVAMPLAQRLADSPLRFVVVCLPVIGVVLGVRALWMLINETDEMQSRKLVESLTCSVAGTVLISFTYGMLQTVGAPRLSWIWVTPLWAICFGVGSLLTERRYR